MGQPPRLHPGIARRLGGLLRLSLLLVIGVGSGWSATANGVLQQRAEQRKDRQELEQTLEKNRSKRGARLASGIAELITCAASGRANGQDEAIGNLINGLQLLAPDLAEPLRQRLAELPEVPPRVDAHVQRTWESTLRSRRDALLRPTRVLAQRAIDQGVAEAAGSLMREYLTCYPDDPVVHRNMGMSAYHGRWYGPRSMALVKQGLVWDDTLGWVVESKKDRYQKGEYCDLDTGAWSTMEQADRAHQDIAKPWSVLTEHLEIHGNASLTDLILCANHLEQFYQQVFSAYATFFSPDGHSDMRTIFGMADKPRLVVNLERTKTDYQHVLPVSAGWSDGMFIQSMTPASYFYVGSNEAMYHEFTHQILGVFAGRNCAPAWLVEGVAVYTQAPEWDCGNLVLGRIDHNSHIQHYFSQLREHTALPAERLLEMESLSGWSSASDPISNYAAAGAFLEFLMKGAPRSYRADLIDYLRDSYQGAVNGLHVWDYLGVSRDTLVAEFDHWTRGMSGEHTQIMLLAGTQRDAERDAGKDARKRITAALADSH